MGYTGTSSRYQRHKIRISQKSPGMTFEITYHRLVVREDIPLLGGRMKRQIKHAIETSHDKPWNSMASRCANH